MSTNNQIADRGSKISGSQKNIEIKGGTVVAAFLVLAIVIIYFVASGNVEKIPVLGTMFAAIFGSK